MRKLVWAFLLASGCDHKHPEEKHKDVEKTSQVTVWDDRFEIFLEHARLVANAATPFVTHVTDLTSLEPRREGKLTFAFRAKDAPYVELVENAPVRV